MNTPYLIPLKLIAKEPLLFGIWLIFIIIFGSAGVFASVISQDWDGCAFITHIENGTFYIISLTLTATYFSDLLSGFYLQSRSKPKKNSELFHAYKIVSFMIIIILFFLISLIYPGIENGTSTSDFSVWHFQIAIFFVTAFIGAYIFSLKHAYLHQKHLEGLHNKAVDTILDDSADSIIDDEGNRF